LSERIGVADLTAAHGRDLGGLLRALALQGIGERVFHDAHTIAVRVSARYDATKRHVAHGRNAMKLESIGILVAGCACIAIGSALLFLRPESEAAALGFITGGVGLLAPGAFRLGGAK
jgi:hypothetical protein